MASKASHPLAGSDIMVPSIRTEFAKLNFSRLLFNLEPCKCNKLALLEIQLDLFEVLDVVLVK